jgi:endonuclease III
LSEKSQRLADLLAKVPASSVPLPNADGRTLLEVGFLCVLNRRLSEGASEKTLQALAATYPDWNELRVSQVQEFQHLIQTKSNELALQVGRDVREYLQEIYQKIHGFNLDALKGDMAEAARFASHLPFLGASIGHYLLHLALPDETPISPAVVRTLDRLGLAKRTTSIKKAQAGVDSLVPAESRKDFSYRMGLVIERWCDAKKPLCWECPLVPNCPFGKKVERDFKQAQRRLEVQRARDEERAKKDAEKERKRVIADEKRRAIAKAKDDARKLRDAERAKAKLAAKAASKKRPLPPRDAARKKSAPKKRVEKKTAQGNGRPKSPAKGSKKKGK